MSTIFEQIAIWKIAIEPFFSTMVTVGHLDELPIFIIAINLLHIIKPLYMWEAHTF